MRLKPRTPKAYLGWAFVALAPLALTQYALGGEVRVLGLAMLASVSVDLMLALTIAIAVEAGDRRLPNRMGRHASRPLWPGLSTRRRPLEMFWPSGALLAGAIIGLVLDPSSSPWVPLTAGALASASKHVVRYRSRHVFNPAAFGLLASGLLFSERASWWGALPALPFVATLAMVAAGAIVLDRSRKLPAALGFLATYYTVFLVVGLITPDKATEAFRSPISNAVLFFALFMLSDPPTAPVTANDQLAYGVVAAAGAAALELTVHDQSFLITALIAANVLAATARALRHQATPRPRALAIQAATLTPVALIIWLASGPLGGGAQPGGASAVLAAQTTSPRPNPTSEAGGGAANPAQPQAFQGQVTGTVRQGTTASGRVEVELRLSVRNQPLSTLEIRIEGTPAGGGGVLMTGSDVALGTNPDPTLYRGSITGLQGTNIAASVTTPSGSTLALQAVLQIDTNTGAVAGTLSAQPSGG